MSGSKGGGAPFCFPFASTLKTQNDREKGAAFPTVSLEDQRLNPKERGWGYDAGRNESRSLAALP
jgi:hypothetical protein